MKGSGAGRLASDTGVKMSWENLVSIIHLFGKTARNRMGEKIGAKITL